MLAHNLKLNKPKKSFSILFIGAAVLIVSTLIFAIWAVQTIKTQNSNDSTQVDFVIQKGEGSGDVAERLEKEKLVKSSFATVIYLNWKRKSDLVQAGEYRIARNLTIPQVIEIITKGKTSNTKITIPEGWQITQIADYLDKNKIVTREDFIAATKKDYDYWFLSSKPKEADLEGFLYPDTYFLSINATAEDIVKKMLDNFDKKFSKELKQSSQTQKLSIYEAVTLASIVEREVANADERKTVAGVFWNRLEIGMPLESCATIQFILNENKKQFTYAETRTPSEYNTYINKGLPKGPIGNPSIESMKAVYSPEDTNNLYFLSADGKTYFSKTLDEHNAKKERYLR